MIDVDGYKRAKATETKRKRKLAGAFMGPEEIEAVAAKVLAEFKKGGWSPRMVAVAGYILDQRWTDPQIDELSVSSDGFVLASSEYDVGMNDFIGSVVDLERNWNSLLEAADLTFEERTTAERLFHLRILDSR